MAGLVAGAAASAVASKGLSIPLGPQRLDQRIQLPPTTVTAVLFGSGNEPEVC